MAQASRARSRQADIFHSRIRRRAPLNNSTSFSMLPGGDSDGHKSLATLRIACQSFSCNCNSPCRRSLDDPDTSSSGRFVKTPAIRAMSATVSSKTVIKQTWPHTEYAASQLFVLLHGVCQLGPYIFQFFAHLGVRILELVFLLHDSC